MQVKYAACDWNIKTGNTKEENVVVLALETRMRQEIDLLFSATLSEFFIEILSSNN